MVNEIPQRLKDLDDNTILWLDRMNTQERENLIKLSRFSPEKLMVLDEFLSLDPRHRKAGCQIVRFWVHMGWLRTSTFWIILTTSAIVAAVANIIEKAQGWTK